MRLSAGRWLILATIVLTMIIMIIVYPILFAKYGLAGSIALSAVLVVGMALYYLRGVMFSRSRNEAGK